MQVKRKKNYIKAVRTDDYVVWLFLYLFGKKKHCPRMDRFYQTLHTTRVSFVRNFKTVLTQGPKMVPKKAFFYKVLENSTVPFFARIKF